LWFKVRIVLNEYSFGRKSFLHCLKLMMIVNHFWFYYNMSNWQSENKCSEPPKNSKKMFFRLVSQQTKIYSSKQLFWIKFDLLGCLFSRNWTENFMIGNFGKMIKVYYGLKHIIFIDLVWIKVFWVIANKKGVMPTCWFYWQSLTKEIIKFYAFNCFFSRFGSLFDCFDK
jgi:hypothetical protein